VLATLTNEQVRDIKLDSLKEIPRKNIVMKYKTNKSIVDNILSGKTWKNIKI